LATAGAVGRIVVVVVVVVVVPTRGKGHAIA
jgi:hypothetical protein